MDRNIRIHNVIIKSLCNPPSHHDLPDDTEIVAQLIIDDSIFLQTVPVKKSTNWELWKLKLGCEIPTYALYFSIAIIRVSLSGGTRLLGKVEASRGGILALVEQNQIFSLDLDKVNDDGPSLNIRAGFSVSLSTPHGAFHQNDAMDGQSEGICCVIMNLC